MSAAEEEDQSNTKSISAKDIVKGKVSLDNLPEPYLILKDSYEDNMAKAINILAIKKGYRVVTGFTSYPADNHFIVMEKK